MYAVVGCGDCSALWVVEGAPETSGCPRCGATREHAVRKKFVTTDDADHAREVRASMLANRQGHGENFAELDSFTEMDDRLDDAGPSEEEYLEGAGLDADEVRAAGERLTEASGGASTSARETLLAGLRNLDDPAEADLIEYCTARGVDEAYVRSALSKLVRAGDVSESRGTYRLL